MQHRRRDTRDKTRATFYSCLSLRIVLPFQISLCLWLDAQQTTGDSVKHPTLATVAQEMYDRIPEVTPRRKVGADAAHAAARILQEPA